ncbi:MAG: xanthine dehydrogenase family protein molybdopterin-binding subunit [Halobacteriales archaeon]|nr:xanthine dehydrogenase family protein molybdopterin-binding subunit [Halobacteriales archaeon]
MSGARSETVGASEAAEAAESFVGKPVRRVEDHRLLTGRAEFVHDHTPEGALHMALVRSQHAHARIVGIDTEAAEAHPDCALVLTGEDVAAQFNPMPCGLAGFEEWSLAKDVTRFAGEPVAAVVATDRYVAEDIAELVEVRYETKPAVVDPFEAMEDEVLVNEAVGTNVPDKETLEFGDVDGAFEGADHVFEGEYSWGRISGVPLETGGAVASYDPDADAFEICTNLQLHTLVDDTVYETLGYDPEDVNLVVPPDVGGSFGTKIGVHRYCALTAMAAKLLETPVKFVEDRVEYLQGGDAHSSDREYRVKLAVSDDGGVEAIDVWFVDDFGAFPRYPVNQVLKPLAVLTNAYDVDTVRFAYDLVVTNKTAQTAYRGFGVDPHLYALEMAMDGAARELGHDPTAFRRQNLITAGQMPYVIPSKNVYDSGDYPAALDRLEAIVDERERTEGGLLDPDVVAAKREEGKYRGTQPAVLIEPGVSGSDWTDRQRSDRSTLEDRPREDVAELPEYLRGELLEDGRVKASLATDSAGQGHQTIVGQLLADELGVLPSDVEVGYRGSAEAPTEYGSAASRLAVMLSGASVELGREFRAACEAVAADHWDVDPADASYREAGVDGPTGERLTLEELARVAEDGDDDRLSAVDAVYEHPATQFVEFDDALRRKLPVYPTAAFAANAPIVEVDVRTGEVEILKFYTLRDCGTLLNPMIVDGQTAGGLAQGIGAALLEEFAYNDAGQPQSTTLFDYRLPSIENVPEIVIEHSETPSPFTDSGAKGTGEGGMIDGPASIATAINAALEPLGVVADQLPFTPDRARSRLRAVEGDAR